MSGNVVLVRKSFEAMRAWDVDALLRLYDPEVEYLPLTGTRVESGGYRGHEGVRAYVAEARAAPTLPLMGVQRSAALPADVHRWLGASGRISTLTARAWRARGASR